MKWYIDIKYVNFISNDDSKCILKTHNDEKLQEYSLNQPFVKFLFVQEYYRIYKGDSFALFSDKHVLRSNRLSYNLS